MKRESSGEIVVEFSQQLIDLGLLPTLSAKAKVSSADNIPFQRKRKAFWLVWFGGGGGGGGEREIERERVREREREKEGERESERGRMGKGRGRGMEHKLSHKPKSH